MSVEALTVWGMLSSTINEELTSLINQVADRGWTPRFEPHATLLGGFMGERDQFIAQVQQLAPQLKPLEIELGEVGISTTFFQNVFVRVVTTAPLLETHLALRQAVSDTREHVFMPHVSLVYGTQTPVERAEMAAWFRERLQTKQGKIDRLVITPSTADPSLWTHLAEITL